jgi:hypothetical protein
MQYFGYKPPECNILPTLFFRINILQPEGEGGAATVLDCFAMSAEESGHPEFRLSPPVSHLSLINAQRERRKSPCPGQMLPGTMARSVQE